jgi:hypothetical protein
LALSHMADAPTLEPSRWQSGRPGSQQPSAPPRSLGNCIAWSAAAPPPAAGILSKAFHASPNKSAESKKLSQVSKRTETGRKLGPKAWRWRWAGWAARRGIQPKLLHPRASGGTERVRQPLGLPQPFTKQPSCVSTQCVSVSLSVE